MFSDETNLQMGRSRGRCIPNSRIWEISSIVGWEEEQHEDDLWKAEQSYEVRWFMYFIAVC